MKKFDLFLCLVLGSLSLGGCNDSYDFLGCRVFRAEHVNTNPEIQWRGDDAIVVNGVSTQKITIESPTVAHFLCNEYAQGNTYSAFHPASWMEEYNVQNRTFVINIPMEQTYGNLVMPSMAYSGCDELYFRPLFGTLQMQLKSKQSTQTFSFRKVSFLSAGESVSGVATASSSALTFADTDSNNRFADIAFDSDQTLGNTPLNIDFVLPANTYKGSWTVHLLDTDGMMVAACTVPAEQKVEAGKVTVIADTLEME